MPDFNWTGALRPHRISPARPIPEMLRKPDYYYNADGYPTEEMSSKQQNTGNYKHDNDSDEPSEALILHLSSSPSVERERA